MKSPLSHHALTAATAALAVVGALALLAQEADAAPHMGDAWLSAAADAWCAARLPATKS